MKRHVVFMALAINHNPQKLPILNVAVSFVSGARNMTKCKKHSQWPDVIRTAAFIHLVLDIIISNLNDFMRSIIEQLKVYEITVKRQKQVLWVDETAVHVRQEPGEQGNHVVIKSCDTPARLIRICWTTGSVVLQMGEVAAGISIVPRACWGLLLWIG
ncbi:Hypothetical predicted protein [Octopus vulgaris]|uniref:Uncharacterized protein n=1 Tax=Octopus vulgaris TaxID=6645 RepID=A0AA36F2T8_OCTVU|nr:Hypothetical predicted protein [Octopus vulgaris]